MDLTTIILLAFLLLIIVYLLKLVFIDGWFISVPIIIIGIIIFVTVSIVKENNRVSSILNKTATPPQKFKLRLKEKYANKLEKEMHESFSQFLEINYDRLYIQNKIEVLNQKINICIEKHKPELSTYCKEKEALEKELKALNTKIAKFKFSSHYENEMKQFHPELYNLYSSAYKSNDFIFKPYFNNVSVSYNKEGSDHYFYMIPFYLVYDEKNETLSLNLYKDDSSEFNSLMSEFNNYVKKVINDKFIFNDETYYRIISKKNLNISYGTVYGLVNKYYSGIIYLPPTITSISKKAFEESWIKEIILNDGLMSIHEEAFINSSLDKIEIPKNTTVHERAFKKCRYIKEVILNDGCSIRNSGFADCTHIDTIIVKGDCTLGNTAFYNVDYVKRIEIQNISTSGSGYVGILRSIVKKSYFTDVVLSTTNGFKNGTYNLFDNIFLNRLIELTYVNVCGEYPNSSNLTNLKKINFSSISTLNNKNYSARNLSEVIFDDKCTLRAIPQDAFKNNPNLEKVTFPKCVKVIKNGAFTNCPKLSTIGTNPQNVLIIDDSITYEENSIGKCCIKEVIVNIKKITSSIIKLINNIEPEKITVPSNIQKDLFAELFDNSKLKIVEISGDETIVNSDEKSFIINSNLTILHLPASINNFSHKSIPSKNSLKELYLSPYQMKVEKELIDKLNANTVIHISNHVVNFDSLNEYANSKSIKITKYKQKVDFTELTLKENSKSHKGDVFLTKVIIPDTIKEIPDSMFEKCVNLQEVVFKGDNLKVIGSNAFNSCSLLSKINLPKNVQILKDGAFENCSLLSEIDISNVLDFGKKAFSNCTLLNNISLNDDVYNIGAFAFEKTDIKSINIPSSLLSIGEGAFKNCSNLDEVTLNEKIKILPASIFEGTALKKFEVPSNIMLIKEKAFKNCDKLKEVTLHKGIKALPKECFSGCSKISDLSFIENVEELGVACFSGCKGLKSIDLPLLLKIVPKQAFKDCTKVESLFVPSTVYKFEESCFEGLEKLNKISGMNKLQIVEFNAFRRCKSLKELCFPRSLRIFDDAIQECKSLIELVFTEDLEKLFLVIDNEAMLEEVVVPNKIDEYKVLFTSYSGKSVKFKMLRGSTCSADKNQYRMLKEYYKNNDFELMVYDKLLAHGYTVGYSDKKIKFKSNDNNVPNFDFSYDAFDNKNIDLNQPKKEKKRAEWDTVVVKEADKELENKSTIVATFINKENIEKDISLSSFGTVENPNIERLKKDNITANLFDISYKISNMKDKKIYISLFNKRLERVSTINEVNIINDTVDNLNIKFELLNNATNSMCLLVMLDENNNVIYSDYHMVDRLIEMDDEFDIF